MINITIHSTDNMTTTKEMNEDTIETLQQMVKEKYPIKEIADFLEANIDLSLVSVIATKEFNAEEIIKSLENLFP